MLHSAPPALPPTAGDATKDRIIEAAGEVFADRGYAAATVREICQRAGVNIAAVNYHFGGKERLYVALLQRAQLFRARAQPLHELAASAAPAAARLRLLIHALLAQMLSEPEEPWERRLIVREITNPTPVGEQMLRAHARRGFDALSAVLAELLPHAPPYRLHQATLSVIGQCLYYRAGAKIIPLILPARELRQHFTLEALAEHIAEFTLAALGAGPSLQSADGEKSQETTSAKATSKSNGKANSKSNGKQPTGVAHKRAVAGERPRAVDAAADNGRQDSREPRPGATRP